MIGVGFGGRSPNSCALRIAASWLLTPSFRYIFDSEFRIVEAAIPNSLAKSINRISGFTKTNDKVSNSLGVSFGNSVFAYFRFKFYV